MKPKQKSLTQLQKEVEEFNLMYSIGCAVNLTKDSGEVVDTEVTNKAVVLGGHSAVAWFKGISGCYNIDRVNMKGGNS